MQKLNSLETERLHLSIVNQFAVEMLSLNTVEEISWHLTHNVIAQLGFEDVVVYLFDEQRQVLFQQAAYGDKNPADYEILDPIEIKLGQGVVGKVAATKKPLLIADTRNFKEYIVDDSNRLSELAVPMVADNKIIGVIDSEHQKASFFTPQHQHTLTAIASIAATKFVQCRYMVQLHHNIEQLEYSSKIQDALFEIAELIFTTDSIQQFYSRLHACIGRLTFARNFFVAQIIDDGKAMILPYCADERDIVLENEIITIETDKPSITGYVLQLNQPLLINEEDIKRLVIAKRIYIKGSMPKVWLGVPFGEDNQRGIVVVQSYDDHFVFKENDKQLLTFVAKHIRNAIERVQSKSQLNFLALHDALTKLPNRLLFADRVNHALENCRNKRQRSLAVFFLDLDRFKQVNDQYGHNIGDKLLCHVGEILSNCLRETDSICRLGGDEFAILLEQIDEVPATEKVAQKIISALQKPIVIDNHNIRTSTSIGIVRYDKGEMSVEQLLINADKAMYQAKLQGRGKFVFYTQMQSNVYAASPKIERDFFNALARQELFLEYQHIVELNSNRIIAAEALVRWQHPTHGLIPPDLFIGELEKSNQIVQLDLYVLNQVIDYLAASKDKWPAEFRININCSAEGFAGDVILARLKQVYAESPDILHRICIEITEQSIVNNIIRTRTNMKVLRQMGVMVALDDFGTGYSSLSYLHQFSFDCLKIDRSFINNLESTDNKSIILETIINLAKTLGIKTTAEGIETAEQYNKLKNMKCTFAQGFHIARPNSAGKLLEMLLNQKISIKN